MDLLLIASRYPTTQHPSLRGSAAARPHRGPARHPERPRVPLRRTCRIHGGRPDRLIMMTRNSRGADGSRRRHTRSFHRPAGLLRFQPVVVSRSHGSLHASSGTTASTACSDSSTCWTARTAHRTSPRDTANPGRNTICHPAPFFAMVFTHSSPELTCERRGVRALLIRDTHISLPESEADQVATKAGRRYQACTTALPGRPENTGRADDGGRAC